MRLAGSAAVAALLLAGCAVDDEPEGGDVAIGTSQVDTASGGVAAPAPPDTTSRPDAEPDMRIEVDIAQRELHVYRGGERVATHPAAVGSDEWATPTGEWTIGQVVWNPRWIPPEEEWAEDEEIREPGDPENPLGRAQLVYRPPNTVHGTNDPGSLGQAVSHGSIRVSNEVAVDLARQVMEAGGAARDEAFYQRVRDDPTERVDVSIPDPVPIRVVSGS